MKQSSPLQPFHAPQGRHTTLRSRNASNNPTWSKIIKIIPSVQLSLRGQSNQADLVLSHQGLVMLKDDFVFEFSDGDVICLLRSTVLVNIRGPNKIARPLLVCLVVLGLEVLDVA